MRVCNSRRRVRENLSRKVVFRAEGWESTTNGRHGKWKDPKAGRRSVQLEWLPGQRVGVDDFHFVLSPGEAAVC